MYVKATYFVCVRLFIDGSVKYNMKYHAKSTTGYNSLEKNIHQNNATYNVRSDSPYNFFRKIHAMMAESAT